MQNAIKASGGGGSSGGAGNNNYARTRVVVMGDSLSARQPMLGPAWPERWAELMEGAGVPIDLLNIAVGGWTFYRATTDTSAYSTGKTMVQRAIELAPDVLIVGLSPNDALINVDGRTAAQIQADAASVFNQLRTALPKATIIWARAIMYDEYTVASSSMALTALKNLNVMPYFHAAAASSDAIYNGCYGNTGLTISSAAATSHQALQTFQSWITSQQGTLFDAIMPLDVWRVSRLGLSGLDGLHSYDGGLRILAAYAQKAARTLAPLVSRWPDIRVPGSKDLASWVDPDALFTNLMQYQSGTGFATYNGGATAEAMALVNITGGALPKLDSWWAARSGARVSALAQYTWDGNVLKTIDISGAQPGTAVSVYVDSAWTPAGQISGEGALTVNQAVISTGTITGNVYVKVGSDVFSLSVYNSPSPTLKNYPPHIELYLSTSQSVSANVFTALSLSSKNNQGGGSWNGSTYTAPMSGRYNVYFQASRLASAATIAMECAIYVNGASQLEGCTGYSVAAGQYHGSTVSGALYLNKGDSVTFQVYCSETATGSYAFVTGARSRSITAGVSFMGW